jgi:hypothetical protein
MTREFEKSGWLGVLQLARNGRDLRPTLPNTRHPAILLVLKLLGRQGVPVLMQTPPWSPRLCEARLLRGLHKSCNEHIDFVRDEMLLFALSGFWTLLPYRLVKDMPNLRLSPLGVVRQRRVIADYSFWGVNADTIKLSPSEAMQFGPALERLLFRICHANTRFGPVYMAKTGLADGFYRLWLAARGIPNFGVVFPTEANEEPLVAFPLALPMGWVESPPLFLHCYRNCSQFGQQCRSDPFDSPPASTRTPGGYTAPCAQASSYKLCRPLRPPATPSASHLSVPGTPEGSGSVSRHLC